MQPSDSRPPVGRGSGRPWPVAYPVPRATRRKKGLPGAWAVLFQRAVGSDPAGCASRLAHRVETAIAFRLHNALGTQNERYFVAVTPTAHSLACLRIGVFVTADAARLPPGVGGSPFTGRVSHPLDGKQSFMTSPHRHSPLTSLAWSHCAPTPLIDVETHRVVFTWILQVLATADLIKGKTIGIDATTLEANAALRSIVRRDSGETYQEFLTRLARASGIETPTRAIWRDSIAPARRRAATRTGSIRTTRTRASRR